MNITKVKLTEAGTLLSWETQEGPAQSDAHEHTLRSSAEPHPDFLAAMEAMITPVLKLLALPTGYADELRVTGLSLTYEEERGRGLVVTCQKKLAAAPSPLIFNTPYMPEDGGEHGQSLPEDLNRAADAVLAAARDYINGKRAQGDLFASTAEADAVERAAASPAVRKAVERLRPKNVVATPVERPAHAGDRPAARRLLPAARRRAPAQGRAARGSKGP